MHTLTRLSRVPRMSSRPTSRTATASIGTTGQAGSRRETHRPKTHSPETNETYYVLTLQTDPAHHRAMCALRARHFPPALLRVAAHISLFHALPGSSLPEVRAHVAASASQTPRFAIRAAGPPLRLGRRGVGVRVDGLAPAAALVAGVQEAWGGMLSAQDRSAFRGHYTVTNKEDDPEKVERCFEDVRRALGTGGLSGTAVGQSYADA
ncbi:hypothetical protein GGR52DRAFT_586131 [Hypoxylon sp. FL1284]|nr:hypothetical protein GGR52DRAFT_586131 [Hypoxylon sp. FL1284]